MALRWGILSAGKISHDFVTAMATVPQDEHQVVSVAARDINSAKKFAKQHGILKYYAGYDTLAQDPDIDIVYIGTLAPLHYETSILMLDHGKHVLCEKPLCMNERQAKKLLDYAKSKKLFFMEGLWVRFFPAYQYLKKRLDDGDLGEIVETRGKMFVPVANVERLMKPETGGGSTIETGIYLIQASLFVFREFPTSIEATGTLNEFGVDTSMKAELTFSGNRKAYIHTDWSSFGGDDNNYTITGTKATITLHQFWSPTKLTDIDGTIKEFPLPEPKFELFFWNTVGLRYQVFPIRDAILAGKLEVEDASHEVSLQLARIEDEIRRQIGVKYPQDDEEY